MTCRCLKKYRKLFVGGLACRDRPVLKDQPDIYIYIYMACSRLLSFPWGVAWSAQEALGPQGPGPKCDVDYCPLKYIFQNPRENVVSRRIAKRSSPDWAHAWPDI